MSLQHIFIQSTFLTVFKNCCSAIAFYFLLRRANILIGLQPLFHPQTKKKKQKKKQKMLTFSSTAFLLTERWRCEIYVIHLCMQHSALGGGGNGKKVGKIWGRRRKSSPPSHWFDDWFDLPCLAAERWQQNENVRSAVRKRKVENDIKWEEKKKWEASW